MSETLVKKALKEIGSDPFTYWHINTPNSLSEYFLRNDLLDPTSDDRHLVASSRVLMTSEEDRKPSCDHLKLDQASHFWWSTLTESTKLSKVSELLVVKEESHYIYITTNLMNLYKDTSVKVHKKWIVLVKNVNISYYVWLPKALFSCSKHLSSSYIAHVCFSLSPSLSRSFSFFLSSVTNSLSPSRPISFPNSVRLLNSCLKSIEMMGKSWIWFYADW